MTQDTRRDRRVKIVSLNVRYKSATVDEFIENHAHDVSRGGIFIKTANPFPPGTLLKFEIRLASDQAVIAGVGRIVWKRDAGASNGERPAGMGVKFIKIDDPSKAVIDRLVNTRVDAGKTYESGDEGPAEQPFARSTPPARPSPAPSAHGSGATRAATPRSTPPSGGGVAAKPAVPGAATTAKATGAHASTPAGPGFARKATMMGLGVSSVPPAGSSVPRPASVPPGARTPFGSAPSVPPRPASGPPGMFPKSDSGGEAQPKEELTVMKQAAELLEDALREAGGSMAEIGANPLFSGSAGSTSSPAPGLRSPSPPAGEWKGADSAKPPVAGAATRGHEAAAHPPSETRRSDSPWVRRDTPSSGRSAPAALAPAEAAPIGKPAPQKGSGTFIVVFVAAAAIVLGLVMFWDRLFGGGAVPEPVAIPPATATAATAAASASSPSIPPAVTAATASTLPETPAPSTSAAPASSTSAATARPEATMATSAETPTTKTTPVVAPPPRPRPVVRPAPPPSPVPSSAPSAAPTDTTTATAERTAAPPVPTESAAPTSTAATSSTATSTATGSSPSPSAKPAPPTKPTKPGKPTDDNPY